MDYVPWIAGAAGGVVVIVVVVMLCKRGCRDEADEQKQRTTVPETVCAASALGADQKPNQGNPLAGAPHSDDDCGNDDDAVEMFDLDDFDTPAHQPQHEVRQ